MAIRDLDSPEHERVDEDEDVSHGVEQAKVESLAGVGRLSRWRHRVEHPRLPAAVIFVNIRIIEMSEAP